MPDSHTSTAPVLRCPDCSTDVGLLPLKGNATCPGCGRRFEILGETLHALPTSVANREIKDNEREGWQKLYPEKLDEVRQFYLDFPYITEDNGSDFYRHATEQLNLVMRMLGSMDNKQGLDIGGGFGWAAYRFTEKGAAMTLADFNDSTPSGLGGAQIYSDAGIHFNKVRVDAEALPFADAQFDFVFCCSFLHHLTNPGPAIDHIARVLRPGGTFFAIMEAFCPFWSSREAALNNAHNIERFTGSGINEQVFRQQEYRHWFRDAGLDFHMVNPRWDEVGDDGTIHENRKLTSSAYEPECLANRRTRTGPSGAVSRAILATNAWRPIAHPAVFHHIRNPLLSASQKLRILIGRKPNVG